MNRTVDGSTADDGDGAARAAKPWHMLSWLATARRQTTFKLVVAIVLVAVAGVAGWQFASNRPLPVRVAAIERNVPVRVFGLGTVEARILSRIGFELGATVIELRADHGDLVRRGDVLARLHSTEQEAKVARAHAGMASAEVAIQRAQANVEKARAILAQRRESNRRKQALVGRSVVSAQSGEEAQRDEEVAKAELAVAISDVAVTRAQFADAQAQFEFERIILEHHTLAAPFDAMVVERHRELGTVIKAGDPIFTLVAPETIWALAYVDESRAGAIVDGQPVKLRLRSLPQLVFDARVERIGIESDRVSEERRVYVKCEQCPPRFHLGEQAEVLITVATIDKAILVPEVAVSRFDGNKGEVWTVEGDRLTRREVRFRHRTEDSRLELISGLPEDAQVVTTPGSGFREGRAARIIVEARQ